MTSDGPVTSEPRIWIVSPVFFDSVPYARLRDEIVEVLAADERWCNVPYEFVVVDDSGATDLETQALDDLPFTRVISPPFNLGHQRAIVFGLRAIKESLGDTDYVVTLDADGEDHPTDVVRLLAEAHDHVDDLRLVVLAQRTTRNESAKFRAMYVFFKLFFRGLTGQKITSGNFAVQRGRFVYRTVDHPSFDLCFSTSLLALRRPIHSVPCARGTRYAGESKMRTFALIAHGIRMMLPFAEDLAVRLLTISVASLGLAGLATVLAVIAGVTSSVVFIPLVVTIVIATLIGIVTFVGFLTLFAGFAQSSAIALQGIDQRRHSRGRQD